MTNFYNTQSSPFGKLRHLSSTALISLILFIWFIFTDFESKLIGLVISIFFGLIEYTWYSLTIELDNGEIIFKPFDNNCRKGKTTKEQLIANILLLPFTINIYIEIIDVTYLRIIFFPLFVWINEILQGYMLMAIYGYNPAWIYRGKYTFFHGNIKISHFKYWICLGFPFHLFLLILNL